MTPGHPRARDPFERFMEKFVIAESGCWEWHGSMSRGGYGRLSLPDGRHVLAHRFSFERFNGPIPDGHFVCHHCDNRPCVNPDHLFSGTVGDNTRDMVAKGRMRGPAYLNTLKTHCPQGHPYDEANTIHLRDGGRRCRECKRVDSHKQWLRKKAKRAKDAAA